MAITTFQRSVCRIIAQNRRESGESYVAGAVPLNTLTGANRVSADIDLFHDTREAVQDAWTSDRRLLKAAGLNVEVLNERPGYVEARVSSGGESVELQWTQDSAFRFFPLIEHEDFGLTLHPVDLATNKTLALVGRLEIRDWIDLITCNSRIQPLGYLAWAASAKDPGFSPLAILTQAARASRYSSTEFDELHFSHEPPDPAALSQKWHAILAEANQVVRLLPPEETGHCVITASGELYTGAATDLPKDLDSGAIRFHPGVIRGAFPSINA